ncbi:hypothetical protein [Paraburkholderia sp. BCC1885]|nr:hypothetical protein [Paraburkholderia sp. BCC1885]
MTSKHKDEQRCARHAQYGHDPALAHLAIDPVFGQMQNVHGVFL